MRALSDIEVTLEQTVTGRNELGAGELLQFGEDILSHWVSAKGLEPTNEQREGFRLLALHRQGAEGDPSFNACRETCRELAYHYNLLARSDDEPEQRRSQLNMMALVANHLCLFVSGKMQVAGLGEFCCSSKPIRDQNSEISEIEHA